MKARGLEALCGHGRGTVGPRTEKGVFKKKKDRVDLASLEGVVTFFGSHHALRAENVLRKNGYRAVLIPGPREISPNCGVALRFDFTKKDEVTSLFSQSFVHYEEIHRYPAK